MIIPELVAFDLDGTLTESKQRVSADMGDLLGKLLSKTRVAVLSGAGFLQYEKQLLTALPDYARLEHLYLFPTNAAQCFVYVDHTWRPQYDYAFSHAEKARVHVELEKALGEVGLLEAPAQLWGDRIEDRGAQISFSPLGQQAPVSEKEQWNREHNELRRRVYTLLVPRLPEFTIAMGGLTTIDITRKGITKAYGIKRLSELTSIAISDMFFIGDALEEGGNDAVVIETGIKTHAVFGPEETATLIEKMLR